MLVTRDSKVTCFHSHIPPHFGQLIARSIKVKNPNNNALFAAIITSRKVCEVMKCVYRLPLRLWLRTPTSEPSTASLPRNNFTHSS